MNFRAAIDWLTDRARAYRQVFNPKSPVDAIVLADLAVFCRANESCAVPGDHDRTMMLLGRNEVWLRIQQHINLTPEQLFALYSGPAPTGESKQ